MKCLLISSYFPPTIGGSATVYGNIFKFGQGKVSILTVKQEQSDKKQAAPEWTDSDGIYRIKYLMAPPVRCRNILQTVWVVLRYDLPVQFRVLLSALRLIKQQKVDVVCIGELQELGWLGVLLGIITSVKVIIYTHGEELTTKGSSRFYGKNAKFYLDRADGIVTVSHYTKNTIIQMFGIPEDKVRLISNGVELDDCHQNSLDTALLDSIRQPNRALLFSVGRLIKRKGFDMAIEAMALVHRQYPDAQLVIAGEGDKKSEMEARIKELNLEGVVTMVGRVSHNDLISFYQGCDIFLMPNRQLENGDTEGFGLVFLEANAFKKPVIGGNAGGAVDAIIHGETGLLVDGYSADDVADAILKLLGDETLRREMGEKGYQWALKNDVKYKVEEFLDYCESVAAEVQEDSV